MKKKSTKKEQSSYINEYEKELSTYKNKVGVIEKAISDLYIDRAKSVLTNDDFYKIKSGLDNDKKRFMEKIEDIETMLLKNKNINEDNENQKKIIEKFLNLKNPDKIMMSELIKRIEIDKKKNVKIYFNFNIKGGIA